MCIIIYTHININPHSSSGGTQFIVLQRIGEITKNRGGKNGYKRERYYT